MSPVEIAIAVVEHEGKFLVGERAAGSPLAGYREFPGGKARPGESPAVAAERECLEETGIPVRATKLLLAVDHEYPHGAVRLRFFLCDPAPSPAPPPRSPFQWIERSALRRLKFPEANLRIIELLAPAGQS